MLAEDKLKAQLIKKANSLTEDSFEALSLGIGLGRFLTAPPPATKEWHLPKEQSVPVTSTDKVTQVNVAKPLTTPLAPVLIAAKERFYLRMIRFLVGHMIDLVFLVSLLLGVVFILKKDLLIKDFDLFFDASYLRDGLLFLYLLFFLYTGFFKIAVGTTLGQYLVKKSS